ncbi:MAG TPA: YbjN domain-containing protein [Polyangia bacterium]|jgi:hypothetical protein
MTRCLLLPALALAFTLLAGCGCPAARGAGPVAPCPAAAGGGGPKLTLLGDDDVRATSLFADFLRQNGIQVLKQEPKAVVVRHRGVGAIMLPKIYNGNTIDRVIVTRVFGPKPEYRGRPEIAQLALELNDKLNIAQFWVHTDGNLMLTTHITFLDELTLAELDAFFVWMSQTTRQMLQVVPSMSQYIE